jgi:hypothetical protein
MGAQVQEKDVFEPPTVNPWLRPPRTIRPSREQTRFAIDLCRTELAYAQRVATINTFAGMSSDAMSELIDRLKDLRAVRLARLRRRRRPRR